MDFWTEPRNNLGMDTLVNPAADPKWIFSGIIFQISEVGLKHITDGDSKTYLCGERNVRAIITFACGTGRQCHIVDGPTVGDGPGARSMTRCGLQRPAPPGLSSCCRGFEFGAAHPGVFHMAFCDGHVEGVSYDIDLLVHQNNANRRDNGGDVN